MIALATGTLLPSGPLAVGCPVKAVQPAGAPQAAPDRVSGGPLAVARRDLRISELTLKRIEQELEILTARPHVDGQVLMDYREYYARVLAMKQVQHKTVDEMTATIQAHAPALFAEWPDVEVGEYIPAMDEGEDRLAELDRQLDRSLQDFDDYLLKQQEAIQEVNRIEDESSSEMSNLARQAAAAVERLRKMGIDIDTSTPDTSARQGAKAPDDGGGKAGEPPGKLEPGNAGGRPGVDGPSPGAPGSAGSGSSAPAKNEPPPATDDDIVARQLRQLAEEETDPVQREKLWQEYRKYKGIP